MSYPLFSAFPSSYLVEGPCAFLQAGPHGPLTCASNYAGLPPLFSSGCNSFECYVGYSCGTHNTGGFSHLGAVLFGGSGVDSLPRLSLCECGSPLRAEPALLPFSWYMVLPSFLFRGRDLLVVLAPSDPSCSTLDRRGAIGASSVSSALMNPSARSMNSLSVVGVFRAIFVMNGF